MLALISWERLIDDIVAALQTDRVANGAVLEDLSQVKELSARVISGELSRNVVDVQASNERENQLRLVVDSIADDLIAAGCATKKGYRATPGPGYYKRYMTLSGKPNWCVEFNTEYWARFGESLLWLSILNRDEYRAYCAVLQAQLGHHAVQFGELILIPLLARKVGTPAEAFEQMTRQARSVAKAIADTSV